MEDFCEFVFTKIIVPTVLVGLVLLIFFGILSIPSCIREDEQKKQQIKECFFQEEKTKECEFILWQYELEKSQPKTKHITTIGLFGEIKQHMIEEIEDVI